VLRCEISVYSLELNVELIHNMGGHGYITAVVPGRWNGGTSGTTLLDEKVSTWREGFTSKSVGN